MSFNTLPNELIYQISQRVQPADLESYGCTSHRVRNIAAPFVQEHRQLKSQYTQVCLSHAAAAELVYDICARPWIALYPQSLEVKSNRNWRTLENPRNRDRAQVERITIKRTLIKEADIKDLLLKPGLIPIHDVGRWLAEISRGEEDHLFALLLASLPNVERLVVRLDQMRMEQMKDMVRSIKLQPTLPHRPKALSKLSDARILEREGASSCDLELFPLLASLPGLKSLYGRNLVGNYRQCYRDGWLSYPGASPTITHISLETCGMSVEGLEMLCGSINALRSFKYIAHRAGWGLYRFSDTFKAAQSTLEELVLSTGAGESRYIGSLRGFTALKHLTVDSGMLVQRAKMQRAVEFLPASIETATLAGNSLTKPQEQQFLGDLYRPSFHYPKLRALYVDDSWGRRNIGKDHLKLQKEFHKQTSYMLRYT